MARLPQPGSDANTWGDILNEFLKVGHRVDGTHDIGLLLQVPTSSGLSLISNASQTNGISWQALNKSDIGLSNVTNDTQVKATDVDTDATLAANSDSKLPSQKAVKQYVTSALNQKISNDVVALALAL